MARCRVCGKDNSEVVRWTIQADSEPARVYDMHPTHALSLVSAWLNGRQPTSNRTDPLAGKIVSRPG